MTIVNKFKVSKTQSKTLKEAEVISNVVMIQDKQL